MQMEENGNKSCALKLAEQAAGHKAALCESADETHDKQRERPVYETD